MQPFATEFPIEKFNNSAAFVAEVVAWLRGTTYSTVLNSTNDGAVQNENAHLKAESGEELRLRELKGREGLQAIGFRHDLPDDRGRLWRTECVLKHADELHEQNIIRFRTQCLAITPGAHLDIPRKPYLIKSLLNSGMGGLDDAFLVTDKPHYLDESEDGIEAARKAVVGQATRRLPVIYISSSDSGGWAFSRTEIEKLAYDVGGVAHVVVEPSRKFSIQLRDASAGRNVYGGTVGIFIPQRGLVRRHYLGWQIENAKALIDAVKATATSLRAQAPASGWDWLELQERALRLQHETYKGALKASDADALFDEYVKQLDELKSENSRLKDQLSIQSVDVMRDDDRGGVVDFVERVGPELYLGEIYDRLRLAAQNTISSADAIGLDDRSRVILSRIIDRVPRSPALDELLGDLARSTRNPKRIAADLTDLLCRHGYKSKSENKHIRLEPLDGFDGIGSITIPKTPSENRGLQNQCKQIERTLGIGKLPK